MYWYEQDWCSWPVDIKQVFCSSRRHVTYYMHVFVLAPLVCFGWTDPHYDTFDGAGVDFQGVGIYAMSEYINSDLKCEGLRNFQVLVDQAPSRNRFRPTSYITSVTIVLPGIVTITIGQRQRMEVVSKILLVSLSPPLSLYIYILYII